MREQKTEEVSRPRDIAILAGLSSPRLDDNADSETMAELEALVETAGGEAAASVLQNGLRRTRAHLSERGRWRRSRSW